MATPDIKAGKYYNLKMLCVLKRNKFIAFETPSGVFISLNQRDLECVSPIPSESPTLVGPAPKYNPCRRFREGDKVRVVEYKGRCKKPCAVRVGDILTIAADEANNDTFIARCKRNNTEFYIDPAYLELVTPVEELEPYKVNHDKELELFEVCHYEMGDDTVEKEGELLKIVRTIYWYGKKKGDRTKEEARAEAEAERDRLNAEHRKEKNNG